MIKEATPEFKMEIKHLIMDTLNITDVDPAAVDDEKPLFGSDNALTLDSVDAIEIIMALQRTYGIRIQDQGTARYAIRSVNSIAEFIITEQEKINP